MDELICISNHVLLALAAHLFQLQRQAISNLNYLFANNKLDHQHYKLHHYSLNLMLYGLLCFR